MTRRMTRTAVLLGAVLLGATGCAGLSDSVGRLFGPSTATTEAKEVAAAEAKRVTLAKALSDSGVSVLRMPNHELQVNVPSDFSFTTDRAEIRAEGRAPLDDLASNLLTPVFAAMRIRIVGYTDSVGTEAVNDALSLARANSVRRHLEAKGVPAALIEVAGRGARDPMAPNDKAYGRTLNRRIEIYLREPGTTP